MNEKPSGVVDERAVADALYAIAHGLLHDERWREAADVLRAMMLAVPRDERAWLGLGRCHEELAQPEVALELYNMGALLALQGVRCRLASARVLRDRGMPHEADVALDMAEWLAEQSDDETLASLVARERRVA